MNTETGYIAEPEVLKRLYPTLATGKNLVEVNTTFLAKKFKDELNRIGITRVGLRSRCPCGSRRRFKSCCYTGTRE